MEWGCAKGGKGKKKKEKREGKTHAVTVGVSTSVNVAVALPGSSVCVTVVVAVAVGTDRHEQARDTAAEAQLVGRHVGVATATLRLSTAGTVPTGSDAV